VSAQTIDFILKHTPAFTMAFSLGCLLGAFIAWIVKRERSACNDRLEQAYESGRKDGEIKALKEDYCRRKEEKK